METSFSNTPKASRAQQRARQQLVQEGCLHCISRNSTDFCTCHCLDHNPCRCTTTGKTTQSLQSNCQIQGARGNSVQVPMRRSNRSIGCERCAKNDDGEQDKIDLRIRVHQDVESMEMISKAPGNCCARRTTKSRTRSDLRTRVSICTLKMCEIRPRAPPSCRSTCIHCQAKQSAEETTRTSLHEHKDVHNQELCRRTMGEEDRAEEVLGSFFFLLFLFFLFLFLFFLLLPLGEGGLAAQRRQAATSAALTWAPPRITSSS